MLFHAKARPATCHMEKNFKLAQRTKRNASTLIQSLGEKEYSNLVLQGQLEKDTFLRRLEREIADPISSISLILYKEIIAACFEIRKETIPS